MLVASMVVELPAPAGRSLSRALHPGVCTNVVDMLGGLRRKHEAGRYTQHDAMRRMPSCSEDATSYCIFSRYCRRVFGKNTFCFTIVSR